jgi:hypothetical protein
MAIPRRVGACFSLAKGDGFGALYNAAGAPKQAKDVSGLVICQRWPWGLFGEGKSQ